MFDRSRRYRYALRRVWDTARPRVVFIMLNPSTADGRRDDPTIRRCMRLADGWGYGSLEVVNLFAWRTPQPALLRRARRPIGPRNDAYLVASVAAADLVVAAWGVHGAWLDRDRQVIDLIRPVKELHCIGLTTGGHPRHPLYAPGGLLPRTWRTHAERGVPAGAASN